MQRPIRARSSQRSSQTIRVLCLLLAALAVGCASATKRFEQGSKLEAQGKLAEAAERYIQALRKDPSLVEARTRLEDIGPELIDQYLRRARRFAATERFVRAADFYHTIDALVRDTGNVGVPLVEPPGYVQERRDTFNGAIDQLRAKGASEEAAGNWAAAMRAYEQVERYGPTARQARAVLDARIRTLTRWSEADLLAERFRAALQHADQAIELIGGPERPAAQDAWEIRQTALERGTLYVAIAPFWRSDGAGRALAKRLSREFLAALNDELEVGHWSEPPLFIAIVPPAQVRREMRLQGYARSVLTTREATRIGRHLGADMVITGELESVNTTESGVSEETRTARTRDDSTATYVVRKGKRHYELGLTYALVHAGRARELQRRTIEAEASGRFHEAQYDGDERDLDLSRSERRLFDTARTRDAYYEVEQELLERLSTRIAEKVYDDILRRVP